MIESKLVLCKSCHYPLKQLSEPRCPECGRGFDPNDPTTFEPTTKRGPKFSRLASLVAYVYAAMFPVILLDMILGPSRRRPGSILYALEVAAVDALIPTLLVAPLVLVAYLGWFHRQGGIREVVANLRARLSLPKPTQPLFWLGLLLGGLLVYLLIRRF